LIHLAADIAVSVPEFLKQALRNETLLGKHLIVETLSVEKKNLDSWSKTGQKNYLRITLMPVTFTKG
jgi:hypothetical protein